MNINFGTYYISPIQAKDAWKLCDFVVANEDRLKLYFPQTLEQNSTPDLATYFTKKKVKQFESKEEFLFTVKEQENNTLVGLVYIKELDWDKKQAEFAYCIGYPFEDKGITSKAIDILSKHAFVNLDLNTLQIIVHKDNLPSIQVAKKCHFTWQRKLTNEFTPRGKNPIDMELYELYNEN